jgi:hypothetical protein
LLRFARNDGSSKLKRRLTSPRKRAGRESERRRKFEATTAPCMPMKFACPSVVRDSVSNSGTTEPFRPGATR